MTELTTKTGQDVAVEVKRIFGDEDAVQIADADILRWINAGQRSIVSVNPILQNSLTRDVDEGVAQYPLPPSVQYVQAIYYDGLPLAAYSYQEAQEYIISLDPDQQASGVPQLWYQWAQTLTLFPKPSETLSGGLRLDYVAIPAELAVINDPLSVPDRYFETLVNYVLQKARQVDDDYDGANYARTQYTEGLAQLSEQENRVTTRQYATLTVRPEDLW